MTLTRCFLGPGGDYRGGYLASEPRNSRIPDLGDLEAKKLDTLEDYRLVAKNLSPQQPGGPKGAGG